MNKGNLFYLFFIAKIVLKIDSLFIEVTHPYTLMMNLMMVRVNKSLL